MTDKKRETNKTLKKNKSMIAYGIIQIGSGVVSAVALVSIALGFAH